MVAHLFADAEGTAKGSQPGQELSLDEPAAHVLLVALQTGKGQGLHEHELHYSLDGGDQSYVLGIDHSAVPIDFRNL